MRWTGLVSRNNSLSLRLGRVPYVGNRGIKECDEDNQVCRLRRWRHGGIKGGLAAATKKAKERSPGSRALADGQNLKSPPDLPPSVSNETGRLPRLGLRARVAGKLGEG